MVPIQEHIITHLSRHRIPSVHVHFASNVSSGAFVGGASHGKTWILAAAKEVVAETDEELVKKIVVM